MDESELCEDPMGAFRMLQGRLRDRRAARRPMIVTSSPRGNRGVVRHFRERIAAGDPDYALVEASSRDNPGTAADYVERMARTMSAREAEQQIEGRIVPDEGTVFGLEWHEAHSLAHRWQWRPGRVGGREINLAIDWGGHYHALLVEYDAETDTDTVFDEVAVDGPQCSTFLEQLVLHCRSEWGISPEDVGGVWCDYNPLDSRIEAYRRWRGRVHHRRVRDEHDRRSGLDTVRWRLLSADGRRRLLVAPRLRSCRTNLGRGAIDALTNYGRVSRRAQGEVVYLDSAIQHSPWSHACDALRYYCWVRYGHLRWHDARASGEQARSGIVRVGS